MGYDLTFYVPTTPNGPWATKHPFYTPQLLVFLNGSRKFISQIVQLEGCAEPVVLQRPLPPHFTLNVAEVALGVATHRNGEPLYYVLAGDVGGLEFEVEVPPLDKAMMAYIRELPSDYPLIPYVTF